MVATTMKEFTTVKDSGERRSFGTGAVRDMSRGKGRFDLISPIFLLRLARHTENGAIKYEERNWEKGIPMSALIDSAIRHLIKYLMGWRDEDHLAAAAWNIMDMIHFEETRPDLDNLPRYTDEEGNVLNLAPKPKPEPVVDATNCLPPGTVHRSAPLDNSTPPMGFWSTLRQALFG